MSNTPLTSEHIAGNMTFYEAARSSFFELSMAKDAFTNLPDIYDSTGEGKLSTLPLPTESDEAIRLNVTKASVPQFSVEVGEYRRGNEIIKFATTPSWESGSLEVDDIVGQRTKDILLAWLYLAYNPQTRKGGRMVDYKKTAYLTEYTQDFKQVRRWVIQGIFVKKVTDEPFDRENDGKRKLVAEFEYDRAYLDKLESGATVEFKDT